MSRNLSKKSFEMNYSLTISKFLRSRLIFQRIEFYSILIEMETTISNCINLQIHFESEKLSRLKSKLLIHPFTKSRACQTCPWQTNVRDRIFFIGNERYKYKDGSCEYSCLLVHEYSRRIVLRLSRTFVKLN